MNRFRISLVKLTIKSSFKIDCGSYDGLSDQIIKPAPDIRVPRHMRIHSIDMRIWKIVTVPAGISLVPLGVMSARATIAYGDRPRKSSFDLAID